MECAHRKTKVRFTHGQLATWLSAQQGRIKGCTASNPKHDQKHASLGGDHLHLYPPLPHPHQAGSFRRTKHEAHCRDPRSTQRRIESGQNNGGKFTQRQTTQKSIPEKNLKRRRKKNPRERKKVEGTTSGTTRKPDSGCPASGCGLGGPSSAFLQNGHTQKTNAAPTSLSLQKRNRETEREHLTDPDRNDQTHQA